MLIEWFRAVARHWVRELIGGVLIAFLALFSELTGVTVPPRIYELAAAMLIFYAMFLAWSDERTRVEQMELRDSACESGYLADALRQHAQELRTDRTMRRMDRSLDLVRLSAPEALLAIGYGVQPILIVANQGPVAEFYAKLSISPEIVSEPREVFCRWTHTDLPRAKIAKGETCRIVLANLIIDASSRTAQWVVRGTSEKGPIDVASYYTSNIDSPKTQRAPDVILTGMLFAEPDLINGPQTFRVVLQAFGSASTKTENEPHT